MPRRSRNEMLGAAKATRNEGESVVLLTDSIVPDNSDLTPWDGVSAQRAPSLDSFQRLPLYAKVTYHPEKLTYGPGGRTTVISAAIQFPYEVYALVDAAQGVQLQDGTYCRKTDERISEDRVTFIIEVTSEWKVKQ